MRNSILFLACLQCRPLGGGISLRASRSYARLARVRCIVLIFSYIGRSFATYGTLDRADCSIPRWSARRQRTVACRGTAFIDGQQ
jgi:hypothetical protein